MSLPSTKRHNDISSSDALSDAQQRQPSKDFFRRPASEIRTLHRGQLLPSYKKLIFPATPHRRALSHRWQSYKSLSRPSRSRLTRRGLPRRPFSEPPPHPFRRPQGSHPERPHHPDPHPHAYCVPLTHPIQASTVSRRRALVTRG